MDWDGHHGGPLFTSAITAAPTSVGTFVPLTINTGGLNLNAGQQYVAFYSLNGVDNQFGGYAIWGYLGSGITGGGADGYTGGNFVFNHSLDTTFAGGWLNPTWYGGALAHDLAFELDFASVPEPSVFALAMATLGLAWQFRRSRR